MNRTSDCLNRQLSREAATLQAWFRHEQARTLWRKSGFAGHPRHYLTATDGLTDVEGLIIGGTRDGADWDREGMFRIFSDDGVIGIVDGWRAQDLTITYQPEVIAQVFPSVGSVPCSENRVQNILIASKLAMMFGANAEAGKVWNAHVQRVYARGVPDVEDFYRPTQLVWIGEDHAAGLVLDGKWVDELVGFSTFSPMIVLLENGHVVRVDPAQEMILNAERIR